MERIKDKFIKEFGDIDYIRLILGIALFCSMAFSSFATVEKMYNLLPFYDFSSITYMQKQSLYGFIKYATPFILAFIYYMLYRIYINLIYNYANLRMRLFDKEIARASIRKIIDPCFIILTIYIGIVDIAFLYFPYLSSILSTIVKEIGVICISYFMYRRMGAGLEAEFKPIVFNAMVWPITILVVLV